MADDPKETNPPVIQKPAPPKANELQTKDRESGRPERKGQN
jgi:hypothetical protein